MSRQATLLPGPARALRALQELVAEAAEEHGLVVVLTGARGSGKTSVIRALQDGSGSSCAVLSGAEWTKEIPFALLGQLDPQSGPRRPGPGVPESEQPESREQVTPAARRLHIAEALVEGLRAEAGATRIIILDDVHLADRESLQVFSLLGRGLRGTNTLLVIALDPTMTAAMDPDFIRMTEDPGAVRVEIDGFGTADALALTRARGMYDIGEHGASILVGHSGGNLRVALEILDLLSDGRWPRDPADLPLPHSVVREVLDPIEDAGSEVMILASALAVLPEPPDLTRLGQVAGLSDPIRAVDLGVASGVFRERDTAGRPTLHLCHPAAPQVLLGAMTPSTRRDLFTRAAASAPTDEEGLVLLAQAASGADPDLADRLSEAAAAAERFGRWSDAAQLHFGSARVRPFSERRDNELLAGIDALASAGWVTDVLPWIEIGKSIPPSVLRDTVLANVAVHRGQAAQADDLLSRAEAADTSDGELIAQIALRRTLDSLVRWDGPKIRTWASRAMSSSDAAEPAHVESRAIHGLGFAAQGRLVEAKRELSDLVDHHLGGAQNQRFRLCAGWVALLDGDLREAVRELEAAVPTQHERGSLRISLWARGWLARTQYLLGEWEEGLRTAEEGLRQCFDADITLVSPLLHWTAAEIKLWRGHPIDEAMRGAEHSAVLSDYLAMQVPARLTRAVAANVRGDHDGRVAALRPLLDVDPWTNERVSFWPWQAEYVDALIAAGGAEHAERAAVAFHAHTASANPHIRALAAVALARVGQDNGDVEAAEKSFDGALDLLDEGQNATVAARVLLLRGQMLRRVNRRREAVECLIRAREFYEGVSAAVLVERCDQELRATGMSWRGMSEIVQARGTAPNPLTPQEMSVADLVVRGMTNAEVARKLFIAEKTVQYHLTHIYGKFGIRSRTELAAVHLADTPPPL